MSLFLSLLPHPRSLAGDNPAAMHHDHVNGGAPIRGSHLFGTMATIVNAILIIAVLFTDLLLPVTAVIVDVVLR